MPETDPGGLPEIPAPGLIGDSQILVIRRLQPGSCNQELGHDLYQPAADDFVGQVHIERKTFGNQQPLIGVGVGVQETHIAHNSLLYHGIKSMQSRSQGLPEQQFVRSSSSTNRATSSSVGRAPTIFE